MEAWWLSYRVAICTVEMLGRNYFVEVYQTYNWFVYASLQLPWLLVQLSRILQCIPRLFWLLIQSNQHCRTSRNETGYPVPEHVNCFPFSLCLKLKHESIFLKLGGWLPFVSASITPAPSRYRLNSSFFESGCWKKIIERVLFWQQFAHY